MAEIGIIASAIGIVGAGTKLSIAIFDFAASIGSAGRELQHVATEISGLCSVLKQLQTVVEHAHFRPSATAIEEVQRIITQCHAVFVEIDGVVSNLRGVRGDEMFPSVDFVSRVKWTFGKKSKVLVLRSTLEACKSTLSVMLVTMLLAERMSQHNRLSTESTLAEEDQEKAVTQSLIIAQQCALEKLEGYEEEVEREEELAMQLPGVNDAATRTNGIIRRKSQGRLMRMFSGLSVITSLPTPVSTPQRLPTRSERASVWLDNMLALPDEQTYPHPGKHLQKRLSSVATANAPLQLLRKWTDQTGEAHADQHVAVSGGPVQAHEIWRDSKFSFNGTRTSDEPESSTLPIEEVGESRIPGPTRMPTGLVSPKTARVQSIGFHRVLGVDGGLEFAAVFHTQSAVRDDYETIMQSILQDHGATAKACDVQLCVSYGGKTKVLKSTDKPLDVLRHYEELELDPLLFLRRSQAQPR